MVGDFLGSLHPSIQAHEGRGGYIGIVIWARLYQGMHALTDVSVGGVNGVACALIAWLALRRGPVPATKAQPSGD